MYNVVSSVFTRCQRICRHDTMFTYCSQKLRWHHVNVIAFTPTQQYPKVLLQTACVPKIVINTIMESLIDGALPPGGKMKCCHAALLIFFSRKSLYCDSVRYSACCMFTCLTRELCISPCTYSPSFYFPCCQKICIYHRILRTDRK